MFAEVMDSVIDRADVTFLLLVYVLGWSSQLFGSFQKVFGSCTKKEDDEDFGTMQTMRFRRAVVAAILVCFCRSKCFHEAPLNDWPYTGFSRWIESGTTLTKDYFWFLLNIGLNFTTQVKYIHSFNSTSSVDDLPGELLANATCPESTCVLEMSFRPPVKWFVRVTLAIAVLYLSNRISEYAYLYICLHKARRLSQSAPLLPEARAKNTSTNAIMGDDSNAERQAALCDKGTATNEENHVKKCSKVVLPPKYVLKRIFRNCATKSLGLNDIGADPFRRYVPYHPASISKLMLDDLKSIHVQVKEPRHSDSLKLFS